MMTGTTHFIMRSGRSTAIAEIPTPDFAVPYLRKGVQRGSARPGLASLRIASDVSFSSCPDGMGLARG
jgi:hypothetical protein